jgi:hypothetical protein
MAKYQCNRNSKMAWRNENVNGISGNGENGVARQPVKK